jgi:hypothetical protein
MRASGKISAVEHSSAAISFFENRFILPRLSEPVSPTVIVARVVVPSPFDPLVRVGYLLLFFLVRGDPPCPINARQWRHNLAGSPS